MTDKRDWEIGTQKFDNTILLLEKQHELLVARICLFYDSIGLVLRQLFMTVDRPALESHIDPAGFELIDESLKLTKEVVNDSVLAGSESAASTMGGVHKVDAEDGHETIITNDGKRLHCSIADVTT